MGFLEERDLSNIPSVPEYYKGKTIFITGGSGFIGKVLVEKLLYSCPDLDRLYLLLRSKKDTSAADRLSKIYALPCFDRLRLEKPDIFHDKVSVIAGDVSDPRLGMSEEDRTLLVNRCHIVFHVAASVRFDDTLTFAAKLNLEGTRQITELTKEMKNLSAFVHVSTSYSNTNRDPVEELMYPPHADWRETLRICEEMDEHTIRMLTPNQCEGLSHADWRELPPFGVREPPPRLRLIHLLADVRICEEMDEHTIRMLTPKYLGEIPNTYTFTKQLAEHVVYEEKGNLPAVIIRPSIVIASIDEPVPAWIENFNGPVGIFVACGKGIMRSIHTKPELILDYIPVDSSVKHIIAAAWIRGTKQLEKTDDIPIYNCCSGKLNQILMGELVDMSKVIGSKVPLNDALWSVGGKITQGANLHYCKVLLQHLLPAIFVDLCLWALGKKTMLVKVQRRIFIANLALSYYSTQQWTFCNKNFVALRDIIEQKGQNDFFYKVENLDVGEYFTQCCYGGRRYLLKEKDEDLPKARAHYKRMVILDKAVQITFYVLIAYWVYRTFIYYCGEAVYDFLMM